MKKSGVGTLHSSGCFRYKEPEVQKSYSESDTYSRDFFKSQEDGLDIVDWQLAVISISFECVFLTTEAGKMKTAFQGAF